jgi:hypothetical protein
MDQKKIDTIIRIRLISYIVFPILTLIIVVTTLAQGFLSGHPALILVIVVSTIVVLVSALFYYIRHEMRKRSPNVQRKPASVLVRLTKLDFVLSFVVVVFEIVLIVFNHTDLGISIVVVIGLVFSVAMTYHLLKRRTNII